MKNNNGFTLVEALISMAIVLFVVVSILSGFTQQMVSNRFAGAKNIAINLAESRLEEYLKFPASQMPGNSVDYVVERGKKLSPPTTVDPGLDNQYRRTVTVSTILGTMRQIRVLVEYGNKGGRYPFRVVMSSLRGG